MLSEFNEKLLEISKLIHKAQTQLINGQEADARATFSLSATMLSDVVHLASSQSDAEYFVARLYFEAGLYKKCYEKLECFPRLTEEQGILYEIASERGNDYREVVTQEVARLHSEGNWQGLLDFIQDNHYFVPKINKIRAECLTALGKPELAKLFTK